MKKTCDNDELLIKITFSETKKKNFIYLDDVLCTGNTLFRNIEDWAKEEHSTGTTNQKAIEDGTAKLIFAFHKMALHP